MGVRSWFAASFVSVVAFIFAHEGEAPPATIDAALRVESARADEGDPALPSVDPPSPTPLVAFVAEPSPCPGEMVLVDGSYCPKVKQVCKRWLDPMTSAYWNYRCAEYAQPSVCLSPTREKKRFCIDREEYVAPGESLPLDHQSWTSAAKVCAARGARLCLESEWELACEGEDMRPYPYGWTRDATACNIDRMDLGKVGRLNDLRAPPSAYPRCVSPYGVHDMSGNIEEWATLDRGRAPDRSTMKGAWWLPGKNTCRAATLGHGEIYEGSQVGVRCCKEAM
jgi:hypothetical protein